MFSIDSLFSGKEKKKETEIATPTELLENSENKAIVLKRLKKVENGLQEKAAEEESQSSDYEYTFKEEHIKEENIATSLPHDPIITKASEEKVGLASPLFLDYPESEDRAAKDAEQKVNLWNGGGMLSQKLPETEEIQVIEAAQVVDEAFITDEAKAVDEATFAEVTQAVDEEFQKSKKKETNNLFAIINNFKKENLEKENTINELIKENERLKKAEAEAIKELEQTRKEKEKLSASTNALKKTQSENEAKMENLIEENAALGELKGRYEKTNKIVKQVIDLIGIDTVNFKDLENNAFAEESLKKLEEQIKSI